MTPTRVSLLGSLSPSHISHLARNTVETTSRSLQTLRNYNSISSAALCRMSYYDMSNVETGGNVTQRRDGFDFLHIMEQRGLRPDCYTYISLLEGCWSSGGLSNAKRLHGKILKSGTLQGEPILYAHLVDVYLGFGDLDDALQVFESMSEITSMLTPLVTKIQSSHLVLSFFSRMLKEGTSPICAAFASVLKALGTGNIVTSHHYVKQIHSKIIRYGFGTDAIVCNPLINLYLKNGCIDLAWSIFEKLSWRDSVSWVAMISGLSQNGHAEEALYLFCQMRKSGIVPTPYVFSSVISATAKLELYRQGEQLHCQALKWGFSSETFISNALIALYSYSRDFISAENVFSEVKLCDGVTYNSLISGLVQCESSDRAFQLFQAMQLSGVKPDCVTVSSLLKACASIEALYTGKQLHSYAIKSGLSSDIITEGSLLDLYVKCSDVSSAHEFFNATRRENVVLWNMMLVAYGQLGNLEKSFELFYQMQIAGVRPNQYTYPSILRTCTSSGALDLGEQIHTLTVKTGLDINVYVCSVLIDMYAKHGRLELARELLERITEEDVVSWTSMISGYVQHDLCFEALKLFEEMQIRGIRSDNIGLSSALSACAGIQVLNQGRQIHAQSVVSGYSMDLSVSNALITLYSRCGRVKEAYLAFEMIDTSDQISWNGLISGFAQSGHYEEALQVFTQMNQAGLGANLFTYCSAVSASANIADIKHGKQIHSRMIKTGYDSEVEAGNVLITLYAKCGSIVDAKREFSDMRERNEVTWNAMITGYSQHGRGSEALDLFEEMQRHGIMPNNVTFLGVLSACSHVGLVSKGLSYLKSMTEEHGIIPRPEHYACVVDILGRAGLLERTKEFIQQMPIEPDAMVWRTLLSACTVHKNVEIGEIAALHLLELEPQDSATYVLLSNIYAVNKKWDCRDRIRQMMKDRGVKKEPGRSWMEVNNSIHAFFVGDRLHPLADQIYGFLKNLNHQVTEIGYVQDRFSPLHDSEQGYKDPSLHVHSEKLAVTFGLISLSPSVPVRVIKNLRICSDCHNWMKLVSKVSNRLLVVRDPYRFHHFEDGACSCGDYW